MISMSFITLDNTPSVRYACMYVSLHVCVHVYIYACMHVHMYGYMYVCMYVSMHVSMHVCIDRLLLYVFEISRNEDTVKYIRNKFLLLVLDLFRG